jgi:hypothetical protein
MGTGADVDGGGSDTGGDALVGKVSANGVGVMLFSGESLAGESSGWSGGELREEETEEVKGELKDERVVPSEVAAGSSIPVGANGGERKSSMSA